MISIMQMKNKNYPSLIPLPKQLKITGGRVPLNSNAVIIAEDKILLPLAHALSEALRDIVPASKTWRQFQLKVSGPETKPVKGCIRLLLDKKLNSEKYVLDIKEDILIKAGSIESAANGASTLLQAVEFHGEEIYWTSAHIEDSPSFEYRGLSIDLARHPHSAENIRRIILLCWFYKIRYLHLHLTDNQGFAFPIKSLPGLSMPSGHPSIDEFNALEEYASARGVAIIPELDVPGHACLGLVKLCPNSPAHGEAVINPVSPKTFKVLETITDEMLSVFKSTPYFHIGADEVVFEPWTRCNYCKEALRGLGLDNPRELYRKFIVRMRDIVKNHKRRTIAWEGFAANGKIKIPEDVIVQFFDVHYIQPEEAIALGHQIINSSWGPLYIAGAHAACSVEMIHKWNPYIFGSNALHIRPDAFDKIPDVSKLKKPLTFFHEPFQNNYYPRAKAIPENRKAMLGAEMCSWEMLDSEEIPYIRHRIAAMSERAWNCQGQSSFPEFQEKLEYQDHRLNSLLFAEERRVAPSPLLLRRGIQYEFTDFVKTWRISSVMTDASLKKFDLKSVPKKMKRIKCTEKYCDLSAEFMAAGSGVAVFECNLTLSTDLEADICLGYDGPVKLWLDNALLFNDPAGSNPAYADKALVPFKAGKGRHRIIIALDANHGKAWGIYLRFRTKKINDTNYITF